RRPHRESALLKNLRSGQGNPPSGWYNSRMAGSDVDALNAGFAGQLLEQYLENPGAVAAEWRTLFESGDSTLLATQPGLVRLLEQVERRGGNGSTTVEPAP